MTRLSRLTDLLDQLGKLESIEAIDVQRFARRHNVSTKTIYRDIAHIKSVGHAVPPFAYRATA